MRRSHGAIAPWLSRLLLLLQLLLLLLLKLMLLLLLLIFGLRGRRSPGGEVLQRDSPLRNHFVEEFPSDDGAVTIARH